MWKKKYEVEGILARGILQLLDEASVGNLKENEIRSSYATYQQNDPVYQAPISPSS